MDEIEPRSAGKVEVGDEGIEELATNELQRTLKLRDRDDIEPAFSRKIVSVRRIGALSSTMRTRRGSVIASF